MGDIEFIKNLISYHSLNKESKYIRQKMYERFGEIIYRPKDIYIKLQELILEEEKKKQEKEEKIKEYIKEFDTYDTYRLLEEKNNFNIALSYSRYSSKIWSIDYKKKTIYYDDYDCFGTFNIRPKEEDLKQIELLKYLIMKNYIEGSEYLHQLEF